MLMKEGFEARKEQLLEECAVAPQVFDRVMPRLERFMEPFVESLVRREQVEHARTFVQGLLSDLDHKNVESIAYRLGQERMPLQWFVGVSGWNDEPLREALVRQVGEQLGEEDGVIGTVARWSFGRPLPPGFRGSWAVGWFSAGSR